MTDPRYKLSDSEPVRLNEIVCHEVCRNARFVFDRPVWLGPGQALELRQGQWFFEGEDRPIDGMWDT